MAALLAGTGAPTFRLLLSRVKASLLSALVHSELPFKTVLSELSKSGDGLNEQPHFQSALNLEDGNEQGRLQGFRRAGVDVKRLQVNQHLLAPVAAPQNSLSVSLCQLAREGLPCIRPPCCRHNGPVTLIGRIVVGLVNASQDSEAEQFSLSHARSQSRRLPWTLICSSTRRGMSSKQSSPTRQTPLPNRQPSDLQTACR